MNEIEHVWWGIITVVCVYLITSSVDSWTNMIGSTATEILDWLGRNDPTEEE